MYGYSYLRSLVLQFHEEAHQEAHQQARRRRLLERARVVAGREQRCGRWRVGLLWGSALSVPSLKVLIVAAMLVASLTLAQGKADAEPMLASWYGPGFEGNLTASGEPFKRRAFTAASPSLPFGTKIRVCYKRGCVKVTVNDRGPYTGGRDLDLSQGAAKAIGLTAVGVNYVDATVLAS